MVLVQWSGLGSWYHCRLRKHVKAITKAMLVTISSEGHLPIPGRSFRRPTQIPPSNGEAQWQSVAYLLERIN